VEIERFNTQMLTGVLSVKVGDLIKVDCELYPRLKEKSGVLVEKRYAAGASTTWIVMIGGRLHPYVISEEDMEVINGVS
jgi:hypothetical protein